MKKLLFITLSLLCAYFLAHSLSDFGLTFSEALTGLIIAALTFMTYVALIMKKA